jgi:hypothetical protein
VKLALFFLLWVAVGVALSVRAARPAAPSLGQVALSALLWPFFLGGGPPAAAPPAGPVARLLAALPAGEPAAGVALAAAIGALERRVARLDAAVAELPPGGAEEARALILAAQARARQALRAAEDEVDVAAARLVVLQAEGDGAGAAPLLAAALDRVRAIEEVEGCLGARVGERSG